mmetsp:Transcript_21360/g.66247  ORF Transcript_21360/g.66247 Transcript_21360/m.66247 type:complete len:288 (-) Transcript_21360:530-1393(-)
MRRPPLTDEVLALDSAVMAGLIVATKPFGSARHVETRAPRPPISRRVSQSPPSQLYMGQLRLKSLPFCSFIGMLTRSVPPLEWQNWSSSTTSASVAQLPTMPQSGTLQSLSARQVPSHMRNWPAGHERTVRAAPLPGTMTRTTCSPNVVACTVQTICVVDSDVTSQALALGLRSTRRSCTTLPEAANPVPVIVTASPCFKYEPAETAVMVGVALLTKPTCVVALSMVATVPLTLTTMFCWPSGFAGYASTSAGRSSRGRVAGGMAHWISVVVVADTGHSLPPTQTFT